jgi:putative hydrolase of the HAD superfamily
MAGVRDPRTVRGVVFDLNGVLLRYASPEAFAALGQLAGLPEADFVAEYWRDRDAYDSGRLSSAEYWQTLGRSGDRIYEGDEVYGLVRADEAMWSAPNPPMIDALGRLVDAGVRIAILSNVPRDLWRIIMRRHPWTARADVTTLSHEVGITKPDSAIFRVCLSKLRSRAADTVFIDDSLANVDTAGAIGMRAWLWSSDAQEEIIRRLDAITACSVPGDHGRLRASRPSGAVSQHFGFDHEKGTR